MPSDTAFKRLLYKIAQAYYQDGLTQQQIGQRFGLSRIKVSRLLNRAREDGIVQITLLPPQDTCADLEHELEKRYSLSEAIVVAADEDPIERQRQLGQAAAACLVRTLQDDQTLGLTWGTTLLAVVDALLSQSLPKARVVQLLGGLGQPDAEVYGADLARRVADTLGAKLRLIPAPGIVASTLVCDALLAEPQIADTLALGAQADLAVAGIGRPTAGSVVMRSGILSEQELAELHALGAVGDIALRFFDANGQSIEHEINERIIGLTLGQIQHIPRVIGVAGGREKTAVIRAALNGKLIDVLVTDEDTARRLV